MAFFRTILIIIIVVYILKLIGRYLIPLLIKRQINKFQKETNNNNKEQKPEGEVTVEPTKTTDKKYNSNDGEYIDYEEIK